LVNSPTAQSPERCASLKSSKFQPLTQLNKATLWTAILHALILIPWGHGVAPLIVFEAVSIPDFVSNNFTLSVNGGHYEKAIAVSSFISLVGHILIIIGLLLKTNIRKLIFIWVGMSGLIISSLNFLFHSFDFIGYLFSFSLPFFLTFIWLIVATMRYWKIMKRTN